MICQDPESIYSIFGQVMRFHYYRTHMLLEKFGVYPGQPPLFFTLVKQDGLSQKELSDRLHLKAATVAVMLKRMEKAGLVERRPDPEDQRILRVYLTEKGKNIHNEVKEALKSMDSECFGNFTDEEKLTLKRLLVQMRDNLVKVCGTNIPER